MAEMSSAQAVLAGRTLADAGARLRAAMPSHAAPFTVPRERPLLEMVPPRPAPMRVLVVEDDPLVRHACA